MPSFTSQLNKFQDKTAQKTVDVLRMSSLEVFKRLVLRSPVDTGRFLANWQTGVNETPDGMLDAFDKTGGPTISNNDGTIAMARIGDSLFIVNNLPYAKKLEDGHSQRAPQGMVAITVAEWDGIVADALEAVK